MQIKTTIKKKAKKFGTNKKVKILNDICEICRGILHDDDINIYSDLYDFGADSLLLAQLARETNQYLSNYVKDNQLNFDVIFRNFLSEPKISSLGNILDEININKSAEKEKEKTSVN